MAKQTISSEIFQIIRSRIIRWEYPPGYRLTEEALCQEFNVSRIPVREALHLLEESHLVEKVAHQGCRVRQPTEKEINELYDVRLALEGFVVEQLAQNGMNENVWQQLYDHWQMLYHTDPDAAFDADLLAHEDELFHETLAAATENETLITMLKGINERLAFVRYTDITTLERLLETCQQHLPILDAIQARDAQQAKKAMWLNIEYGRRNVESALKDVLSKAYLLH